MCSRALVSHLRLGCPGACPLSGPRPCPGPIVAVPPQDRQARIGTDRPASGQTGPPQGRQAHLRADRPASGQTGPPQERQFFIDNLLVRIHFIIVVMRSNGLAPWEFEFPFPGSFTSTFLVLSLLLLSAAPERRPMPPLPSPRPRGRPPALRERPGSLRCTT